MTLTINVGKPLTRPTLTRLMMLSSLILETLLTLLLLRLMMTTLPACAQWCIFSIVRGNFEKDDLCSAPIARALPRYIVPFFKVFETGNCFKTMLF